MGPRRFPQTKPLMSINRTMNWLAIPKKLKSLTKRTISKLFAILLATPLAIERIAGLAIGPVSARVISGLYEGSLLELIGTALRSVAVNYAVWPRQTLVPDTV